MANAVRLSLGLLCIFALLWLAELMEAWHLAPELGVFFACMAATPFLGLLLHELSRRAWPLVLGAVLLLPATLYFGSTARRLVFAGEFDPYDWAMFGGPAVLSVASVGLLLALAVARMRGR